MGCFGGGGNDPTLLVFQAIETALEELHWKISQLCGNISMTEHFSIKLWGEARLSVTIQKFLIVTGNEGQKINGAEERDSVLNDGPEAWTARDWDNDDSWRTLHHKNSSLRSVKKFVINELRKVRDQRGGSGHLPDIFQCFVMCEVLFSSFTIEFSDSMTALQWRQQMAYRQLNEDRHFGRVWAATE
jgi:hypothetical protein